jgi:hypothetical protein
VGLFFSKALFLSSGALLLFSAPTGRRQFKRQDFCFRQFYFLSYQIPRKIYLFQAVGLGTLPNCVAGSCFGLVFYGAPVSSVA